MLKIDFLNVGKGNCTVIQFPSGKIAIIDIDNSKIDDEDDILQDPIDFLDKKYSGKSIFRFILTHPDMDHMSGIDELFDNRKIYNFWDTEHDKELDTETDDFGPFNTDDWKRYQDIRKNKENPKALKLFRDATSECCWTQDDIQILSPSQQLTKLSKETKEGNSDKYNHISYVLRIEYLGIVILLGGDATKAAWQDIFDHYNAKNKLDLLKADIFLAPHHGSENNINKDVFEYINPDFVVVSVHRGKDYAYDYYNSLANKQVYSTKHHGNISVEVSDDRKTITPEKNG